MPTIPQDIAAARTGDALVEMVDGRVYVTPDNWATVFIKRNGRVRLVTDKQEADLTRFIAVAQASA